MPLDVIMPALGMAQESGVIVSWHKRPGDSVAEGDVLFEVETDKATMEVEAQAAGFLSAVTAGEGDEVPVGKIIARITDTAEDPDGPAGAETPGDTGLDASAPADDAEALPAGEIVIMPTLGMAQDSGLLVGWLVEPGSKVAADDPLFEVETDKSTMEVPAGVDGYLAALLAHPGEDVPTGEAIAVVSPDAVANPVVRSAKAPAKTPAPPAPKAETAGPAKPAPATARETTPAPSARAAAADPGGRILASPKARRLALERGLDLARLVEIGHPQPYHVKDLELLEGLPAAPQDVAAGVGVASRRLTADLPEDGFSAFAQWAADSAGLGDAPMLLAALAGACLETPAPIIAHEAFGRRRLFNVLRGRFRDVTEIEDGTPDLVLRDLRTTRLSTICLGAESAPVLSITTSGSGLSLTLECASGHLSAEAALALISEFAGRLEQPLRHLL